jgi:hypothetical protein
MVSVKCLYCDADNDPIATSGYCDKCGKKLPPAAAFRSRRHGAVGSTDEPAAEPGPRQRTAEALLAVTALQLIGGGLFLVLAPVFLTKVPPNFMPLVLLLTLPAGAVLGVLTWLARRQTTAAALGGVLFYFVWTVGMGVVVWPDLGATWLPYNLIVLASLFWPVWVSRNNPDRSTAL